MLYTADGEAKDPISPEEIEARIRDQLRAARAAMFHFVIMLVIALLVLALFVPPG